MGCAGILWCCNIPMPNHVNHVLEGDIGLEQCTLTLDSVFWLVVLPYGYWNCSAVIKTKARILLESLWESTSGNKAIILWLTQGSYVKLLGYQNTSSTMAAKNIWLRVWLSEQC